MSSNFVCGLLLYRRTSPPPPLYFSLLVSLSFSTTNVCKTAFFFLVVSIPNKAFVFPKNNKISEACICPARAGSGKPAFLHAFPKLKNKTAEKISSFRGQKKNGLKSQCYLYRHPFNLCTTPNFFVLVKLL